MLRLADLEEQNQQKKAQSKMDKFVLEDSDGSIADQNLNGLQGQADGKHKGTQDWLHVASGGEFAMFDEADSGET